MGDKRDGAVAQLVPDGNPVFVGVDYGHDEMITECEVEVLPDGVVKVLDIRHTPASGKNAVDIPSPEEIEQAKTPGGGWTRAQLAEWGVSWPPPKGWRRALENRRRDQS